MLTPSLFSLLKIHLSLLSISSETIDLLKHLNYMAWHRTQPLLHLPLDTFWDKLLTDLLGEG